MKLPEKAKLKVEYDAEYMALEALIREFEVYLESILSKLPSNITIKGRIKSFESYYQKILRYIRKKAEKNDKSAVAINDKIGLRVICPFLEDVQAVRELVERNFEVAEVEIKGSDLSFKEFGYESMHIIVRLPDEISKRYKKASGKSFEGDFAEIQVRTILQEAWAEVEHEFVYKAEFTPFGAPMRRKLAAINANLSLTDTLFQEFRSYQRRLNKQIMLRREGFFDKIESDIDAFIKSEDIKDNEIEETDEEILALDFKQSNSIDDLLLNALYAHNKGQFEAAEKFYSRILELKPEAKIKGIIFQHRGIAYFSQSKYKKAIADFKNAIKYNENAHTPLYYLGIVHSCLKNYDDALEAFSKAIALNPHRKYCYFRRAEVYFHLGDYPAALADCNAAENLDHTFEAVKKLRKLLMEKLKF